MKIYIKNQTACLIAFCLGENGFEIDSDEEIAVEVEDGDCMYIDDWSIST